MACSSPLKGWYSRFRTPNGKRAVTFNRSDAFVDQPVTVPCGQCIKCRLDKVQAWATRLEAERQFHEASRFLTVTYDDDHLPEGATLSPSDLTLFLRRLRRWAKAELRRKLRFYAGAEYGDDPMVPLLGFDLGRPHYHLIAYGIAFPDEKVAEKSRTGEDQFSSEILDRLWGKGRARIGLVTRESCSYVAGYAVKKITGDKSEDRYKQYDPRTGLVYPVEPEFSRMSRRPGIGRLFAEKYRGDVYPADHVVQRGKTRKVPRYFDKVVAEAEPQLIQAVKAKRVASMLERAYDNTLERLEVKAEVAWRKSRMFKRDGAG